LARSKERGARSKEEVTSTASRSLSFLPSRHQIEHKISSLRGYGMTTFYFMMGIYVHIDGSFFEKNFGWSILFTGIVVFVGPVVIWVMGWIAGLTSRTTVYTSLLSNSLGETTLTLQVLAYQAAIFDKDVFLVLVVSTLMSINLCCLGTIWIDKLYEMLRPLVGPWLDSPSSAEANREKVKGVGVRSDKVKGHVVILGFNETGQDLAEYFREQKQEVFVVDLDPSLHAAFKFAYKGVRGHRKPRCDPIEALATSHAPSKAATSTSLNQAAADAGAAPAAAHGIASAAMAGEGVAAAEPARPAGIEAESTTVAASFDGPAAEDGPAADTAGEPVAEPAAEAGAATTTLPGVPDEAPSAEPAAGGGGAVDGVAVAVGGVKGVGGEGEGSEGEGIEGDNVCGRAARTCSTC
jgi:hypothetical protein